LRKDVATLGLIWLTAFNLRVLLFAIPPTLPAMRADLGLSYLATGSITSVAVLALGIASIPGALLATRFGARRLVTVCAAGHDVEPRGQRELPPNERQREQRDDGEEGQEEKGRGDVCRGVPAEQEWCPGRDRVVHEVLECEEGRDLPHARVA